MPLLDGSRADDPLVIQTGANYGQTTEIAIGAMDSESLGVGSVDVQGRAEASNAIGTIDNALNDVSMERARLGAIQNRLEFRSDNLSIQSENTTASESRMRDTDMAQMMTAATRDNILANASMSLLAQANAVPQMVLKLLS
jgi:flagellin